MLAALGRLPSSLLPSFFRFIPEAFFDAPVPEEPPALKLPLALPLDETPIPLLLPVVLVGMVDEEAVLDDG